MSTLEYLLLFYPVRFNVTKCITKATFPFWWNPDFTILLLESLFCKTKRAIQLISSLKSIQFFSCWYLLLTNGSKIISFLKLISAVKRAALTSKVITFMQIFHLLKTSLFLVLSPALVMYSVVSLSYSSDFFPPQVRNVAQLVLQKNKFKSFIVMANTLYLFSPRLNYQPALWERSLLLPQRQEHTPASPEQQKSSLPVLFSLMIATIC